MYVCTYMCLGRNVAQMKGGKIKDYMTFEDMHMELSLCLHG